MADVKGVGETVRSMVDAAWEQVERAVDHMLDGTCTSTHETDELEMVELSVCRWCAHAIAYGEADVLDIDAHFARMERVLGRSGIRVCEVAVAGGVDVDTAPFCATPCDACGWKMAGVRVPAVALRRTSRR